MHQAKTIQRLFSQKSNETAMNFRTEKISCAVGQAEAIDFTSALPDGRLLHHVHFYWPGEAAPTTSENIVMTVDRDGTDYDIPLNTTYDPSELGYNLFVEFDPPLAFAEGDMLKIEYTNTDDLAIVGVVMWEL
jgi:hypothetical protein